MFRIECKICKLRSQISTAEISLRNINNQLSILEKDIPRGYKSKRTLSVIEYKQHFSSICGRCTENFYTNFSSEENKTLARLKTVLSYYNENDVDLDLNQLKLSCRGTYSNLYKFIEMIQLRKK